MSQALIYISMSIFLAGRKNWLQQQHEENELRFDYGYAYDQFQSDDLRVIDWGRPSKYETILNSDGCTPNVPIWVVFWVAVYVRDFPADPYTTGWTIWARYPTKTFREIPKLFLRYLGTGGIYKRL